MDSDEKRMEFATEYLEQLRFLYRDTDGNKKVCHHDTNCLNASNDSQRGLFGGPFVIKTFATHLSAIDGCQQVSDLHDSDEPHLKAVGALGLAAASVCALLYITATGFF
jgi:hypothetical protein